MSEKKTTPKIEPTFDEDGNACYQLFSTPKEKILFSNVSCIQTGLFQSFLFRV